MKTCFEQLNTEKTCRAIVLTGSGKAFSTGKFLFIDVLRILFCIYLGIDVKYLSNSAVTELGQIDDIARKALHLRRMIQRTQNSLRAVDKVPLMSHLRLLISTFDF